MSKQTEKDSKIIQVLYCILVFLIYIVAYNSRLSLIKYSYGTHITPNPMSTYANLWDVAKSGYIAILNSLYYFLGEKVIVITGLHIGLGFVSFLFLFFAVRHMKSSVFRYGIPLLYVLSSFLWIPYLPEDGWILIAVAATLLFLVLINLFFALFRSRLEKPEPTVTETLAQREKRERQAPKTIVNEKGETIRLLANPLPGPKKHVKKTLDYDLDVPEDLMHYDVPVNILDDYDHQ